MASGPDGDLRIHADIMAMALVGQRHDKRDLVDLVRWLLVRNPDGLPKPNTPNDKVSEAPDSAAPMGWLESIQKQAAAYRHEDNGDESKWSIYNQGRADALDRMEEDLRRMLATSESVPPETDNGSRS